MMWIAIAAIAVMLAASASLLGSWHTRRDIATGRPSYLSLADHTGVWQRERLAELFGSPDEDDRYTTVPGASVERSRKSWHRIFDSVVLDLASLLGAAASLWLALTGTTGAVWFLMLCGGYQLVSWAVTAWIVARNASWDDSDSQP